MHGKSKVVSHGPYYTFVQVPCRFSTPADHAIRCVGWRIGKHAILHISRKLTFIIHTSIAQAFATRGSSTRERHVRLICGRSFGKAMSGQCSPPPFSPLQSNKHIGEDVIHTYVVFRICNCRSYGTIDGLSLCCRAVLSANCTIKGDMLRSQLEEIKEFAHDVEGCDSGDGRRRSTDSQTLRALCRRELQTLLQGRCRRSFPGGGETPPQQVHQMDLTLLVRRISSDVCGQANCKYCGVMNLMRC
jgi:hypothetical protein